MRETAHITNLGHELRSSDFTSTIHGHDHLELRQQGGQTEHLAAQDVQRVIDGVQAVHGLGNEQLRNFNEIS